MADPQPPGPIAVAPNAPDKTSEPLKYQPQHKLLSLVLGIFFAVFIIAAVHFVGGQFPLVVSLLILASVIGLSLFRTVKANFIDVQSRTIEWLAAIFFCGVLMSVSKVFVSRIDTLDGHSSNYLMIVLAVAAAIWSFGGAGWGWRLAKRMNESDGRRRLYYIFAAWGAVFGVIGIVVFAIAGIMAVAVGYETNYVITTTIGALLIPLVVPAYRLDKAAPLLTSQASTAFKPAIIDNYEPCHFGPQRLNPGLLILHLTGFSLLFLPLLVFRMLKKRARFECTELEFAQFPAPVAEFVDEYHEPLRELGYQRAYFYRAQPKGGNIVTFGVLYAHPQSNHVCCVTAAYLLTHKGATVYRCAFDLSTRYSDETIVSTNNSSELHIPQFKKINPRLSQMQFPEVEDVALLHRIHCARLKKHGKPEIGILPESAQSLAGLQTELDKRVEMERKVQISLPAAYWATWSIVWPASLVRLHRLRKRAHAEMAELGFDEEA